MNFKEIAESRLQLSRAYHPSPPVRGVLISLAVPGLASPPSCSGLSFSKSPLPPLEVYFDEWMNFKQASITRSVSDPNLRRR